MADLVNTIQIDIAAAPGTPLLVKVFMDHTFAVALGGAELALTREEFYELKRASEILTDVDWNRQVAEDANA